MKHKLTNTKGFTLIEMLLVLVVVSILIWSSVGYIQQRMQQARIDKTTAQMQQILNAGLSYYVANGSWPPTVSCLQGSGGGGCSGSTVYLPTSITSPWSGGAYNVYSSTSLFYVYTTVTTLTAVNSGNIARIIAGSLPLAYVSAAVPPAAATSCGTGVTMCNVITSVNIPGQNINNARSVNFAGLYHHGACVPVPTCPVDASGNTMTPQVMVVPVSVSGVNDANTSNVYPISSFTAYATGPAANPPACASTGATQTACSATYTSSTYWRACMQVVTEKGDVSVTNTGTTGANIWGSKVTLLAITRCAVNNEPSGSPFTIYTQ
ncbi:MAG: prepilin-type N-terminal cleavage/methylation domain-containing protein [Gammaproteobacteria bacterium]|nr:prepilin-type N-terminal cleavage/methylation domain-containing protein [Gammaproteobacteria bacterium]